MWLFHPIRVCGILAALGEAQAGFAADDSNWRCSSRTHARKSLADNSGWIGLVIA
jgi:hypothetical protein